MNDRSDIEHVLATWFEDGPSTMPDRVVDIVADRIGRQSQRRAWRLDWRPLRMTTTLKLATAAVAVAIVAILGYNLLPSSSPGLTGPSTSPSAKPSPSPSPLVYTWPRALAAGTYTTPFIWDTPITVTFTVPDGWESRDVEIIKDPVSRANEVGGSRGMSVVFSLADNVYMDPCGAVLRDPTVGPSARDFADGLAALLGIDVTTPPTATRLDGNEGYYLEFSVPDDLSCPPDEFHVFSVKPEWMRPGLPSGPPFYSAERQRWRVWVLDVNGSRYLIAALSAADAAPADLDELQGVIDSISIDVVRAPSTTQAPQPAP